jgi:hypothetical protein
MDFICRTSPWIFSMYLLLWELELIALLTFDHDQSALATAAELPCAG